VQENNNQRLEIMKAKLHHFAYDITPGNLEVVIELFEKLGYHLHYRIGEARWCMIRQGEIPVGLQIIETNDQPVDPIEKKINTHVAFLSADPKGDISEVEKWCAEKGIEFRRGGWSEKELWFDLPDVFVNFVVEIMHTSVVE